MILETVLQSLDWSKQQTIAGDCFNTADLTFGTLVVIMALNAESPTELVLDVNLDEILKEPHKIDEVVLKISFVENQNMYVIKSLDEYKGKCPGKKRTINDITNDELVAIFSEVLKMDKNNATSILVQMLKQAKS